MIKTSKSFLKLRNIDNSSLLKVSSNNFKSVFMTLIESTFTPKNRTRFSHSVTIEYLSVLLLSVASLVVLFSASYTVNEFYTLVVSLILVSHLLLGVLELSTRGWKNTDLALIFTLKFYLPLLTLVTISKIFPANNIVLIFTDLLLALFLAGSALKESQFFVENSAEETIVDFNLLAQFLLIIGFYLTEVSLLGSELYFVEVLAVLTTSIVLHTWVTSKGQKMRLETLVSSSQKYWIGFVIVYVSVRSLYWMF